MLILLLFITSCLAFQPTLNLTRVVSFGFQEIQNLPGPDVSPDLNFTCWREKLGLSTSEILAFRNLAYDWYYENYGIATSAAKLLPLSDTANVVPGYGICIPVRTNLNYRVICANPPLNTSEPPILTACNFVLIFATPIVAVYGGTYGTYLLNRGIPPIIIPTETLNYGSYAMEFAEGYTREFRLKSQFPIDLGNKHLILSERGFIEDKSPTDNWGTGQLFGTSNYYPNALTQKWVASGRPTWTFGEFPPL